MTERRAAWIALAAVLAAGLGGDAHMLFAHRVAVGRYGYEFALQAVQVAHSGRPWLATAAPLFAYLAGAVSLITRDPVAAAKLVALGAQASLALGVFALVRRLTGLGWAGILAAAIVSFGLPHEYLVAEFPDELLALALLAWTVVLWPGRPAPALRYRAPVVLLVAAALAHPTALLLAAAAAAFAALAERLLHADRLWPWLAAGAAVWALPAVAAVASPKVAGIFAIGPNWPLGAVAPWDKLLLFAAAPTVLAWLIREDGAAPGQSRPHRVALTGACLFGLLVILNPFFRWPSGYTAPPERIAGLAPVALAFVLAALAMLAWQNFHLWAAGAALLPIALVAGAHGPSPPGLAPAFLDRQAHVLAALRHEASMLPTDAVIVAQSSDRALVVFATGHPCETALPDGTAPEAVFWLLDGVPQGLSDSAMTVLCVTQDANDPSGNTATVLVPAPALRLRLAAAGTSARDLSLLALQNPQLGLGASP